MENFSENTSKYTNEVPDRHNPNAKKEKHFSSMVALALCCAVLGGIIGAIGTVCISNLLPDNISDKYNTDNNVNILIGQRENTSIDITQIDTSKIMTPAELYAANVNSTVGITTSVTTNFWGYQTTSAASGSGFILSDDGYILTNFHVIEDSDSIHVHLYTGESYNATLVGYDKSNDIALLKIQAEGLTPVILGDSDNTNVGDVVVAIGNPLGELTFSLTAGAVSALNREVTMSNGVTMTLMQTDCAINSGNSGGALFNLYGEVIGITNAKYSSSSSGQASIDNIGFAIPINDVRNMIESIIEKGYISKPYIGVSVQDVSAETQSYGLPQGASVKNVTADSPAEKAGLRVNDIITSVNGSTITGSRDLVSIVNDASVGDTLSLTVYRQGNSFNLSIKVGEQIQSALDKNTTGQESSSPSWGFGGFSK